MIPKAILLDLDDTIIAFDHGIDLDAIWKNVCKNYFSESDEFKIDDIIRLIREKAKWYWSDPERHRIGRLDLQKARADIIRQALCLQDTSLSSQIAMDYGLQRDMAVFLYPDAIETINRIKELGIKLALITNGGSAAQRQKIDRFKLSPLFDHVVIEEEYGLGKPDPRVYLHAVNLLGVKPEQSWMVGDNFEWEIIAPQKLGIKGIWINPKDADTGTLCGIQPFRSIRTLSEIKYLLAD